MTLVVLALAVVALGALLVWQASHPERRPLAAVGFSDNAVAQGLLTPEGDAALLARAGVRVVRVQFDWNRAEPSRGVLRLGPYDALYHALTTRGIGLVLVFAYAPSWASNGACDPGLSGCHTPPAPQHVSDAAGTAATLARRYPRLRGLEIWNEPNTAYFWAPRADPRAYLALLRACALAVRAAAPHVPVIGGALADPPAQAGSIPLLPYLDALLDGGALPYLDALSLHPYPDLGDRGGESSVQRVLGASAALRAHGAGALPLWLDEVGVSTTGPSAASERGQAQELATLLGRLRAIPGVAMFLVHTLVQPPGDLAGPEPGFGLVRSDGSLKPAFCVVASAAGAQPPPACQAAG